ncbi:MAG: PilZ domain-containing protein [Motiliproteus sp.]|nr:PilZ domain-containing protein [Motiliproteus sp.]MCW9054336.1 PilZ domain-containing protein [Motiliproteus sp.]
METEKRQQCRLHVVWKATLTRLNGEQLPGSTDDVSESGMNVILDKELVMGEPVSVEVVSKCTGQLCYFMLDGVIIYNRDLDSNMGFAVGLRLLDPAPCYIEFVRRFSSESQYFRVG